MGDIVRVNRVPYSGGSCLNFFAGFPYKGVKEVKYKEKRAVKVVHDAQPDGRPVGITAGVYEIESLSFKLLRDSATALMVDLSTLGLGSYGDAEFAYMLQVYEPVNAVPIQTLITGIRITNVEEGHTQESPDELVTDFTAMGMWVTRVYNGSALTLWSQTRAQLG
jgi:hypothetical protein